MHYCTTSSYICCPYTREISLQPPFPLLLVHIIHQISLHSLKCDLQLHRCCTGRWFSREAESKYRVDLWEACCLWLFIGTINFATPGRVISIIDFWTFLQTVCIGHDRPIVFERRLRSICCRQLKEDTTHCPDIWPSRKLTSTVVVISVQQFWSTQSWRPALGNRKLSTTIVCGCEAKVGEKPSSFVRLRKPVTVANFIDV